MELRKPSKGEFKVYQGVAYSEIVRDNDGEVIINPDRETASKYLDIPAEGDEIKYLFESKLTFGNADLMGNKYTTQEKYDEMMEDERESYIPEEVVPASKIRFLMKTILGEGKDKKEFYYFLDFMFYGGLKVTRKGNKALCFNDYGQNSYTDASFSSYEGFKNDESSGIRWAPNFKPGSLGILEFIDFLYSYSAQAKGKVKMLDGISFEDVLEGDISSVVETFNTIVNHEMMQVGNKTRFGAKVLFMGVLNKYTNNRLNQDFYPAFERGKTVDGIVNKTFKSISADIMKSRQPSKGKIYSPESKGWYFGGDLPTWGLEEIKEVDMQEYLKLNGGSVSNSGFESSESSESKEDNPFAEESDLPMDENPWA